MPNDFNPTYTEAPRFRLPFRSVFMPIVPCVLDGCLSLLELISKLEYIINQYHDAIEANHNDIVALAAYVDGAIADLRTYIDTQDAATLASAKSYCDSAIATLTTYINDQDTATLNAAKTYCDAAIADLKAYTDDKLALKQDLLTFDSTPTANSSNPVTSHGIKLYVDNGLSAKQDILTFDAEPTADSQNPARSGGIYSQISAVAGRMPYMITAVLNNSTVTCNETYTNIANRLQTRSATSIVILTDEGTNSKEIYYMTSVTANHIDFTATSSGHTLTVDSTNTWAYNV